MALLRIFRQSELLKEVALNPGEEYIAGRSPECQIVLDPERGVSRQHFKLVPQGETWMVEVLSRFGELYVGREKVSGFELKDGFKFLVPPYEFEFVMTQPEQSFHQEVTVALGGDSVSEDFSDRTQVGVMASIPYLKVISPQGELFQIFRLEGHSWQAGRDTSCSIFIDHQTFSRKQFEIQFQEGVYLVRDLESSNGTLHNGMPLGHEWSRIESGDVITVVDWTLQFELRDASYEQRLQEIPEEFKAPVIYDPHAFVPQPQYAPESMGYQAPPPLTGFPPTLDQMHPGEGGAGKFSFDRKTMVRMAIGGVAVLGLLFYFMDDGGGKVPADGKVVKALSPFDKLSGQQQQYIKDTYRLADSLFKQGRYEMARQEIAKIHQLVPYYEESKNIEQLANVAIQTQIDQQKAEAREKDRIAMEETILRTVNQCQKLVNSTVEMKKIDDCLGPVIALNPEHPQIVALKAEVDKVIADRLMREERKAEYAAAVRRHKSLYEKAEKAYRQGSALEALSAYEQVVKSTLPDPEDLKEKAKRQVASIKEEISEKQSEFKKSADVAAEKGDLKTAVEKLQSALKIDPGNKEVQDKIDTYMRDLKKNMQALYQEGILEESVGEVETAKAKWKKIIEQSLPEEEYYKKARIKLKKYGAF